MGCKNCDPTIEIEVLNNEIDKCFQYECPISGKTINTGYSSTWRKEVGGYCGYHCRCEDCRRGHRDYINCDSCGKIHELRNLPKEI